MKRAFLFAALLWASAAIHAAPQNTAFTYHGNLTANGAPLTGSVDLAFKLFDAASGGTQVGTTITVSAFPVVGGRFTLDLDFPSAFTGQQRWVEVSVSGQTLTPRQPVNAVPVAAYALSTGAPNTVSLGAGDTPAANGAALRSALAVLAAQPPTASNPVLVKLGPGVYDLGATPLAMLAYVHLEGSGQGATQLVGDGQATATSGVILMANDSELRALSVQSRAGAAYSTAVYADSSVTKSSVARNIAAQSLGGSTAGIGIHNNGGSPVLDNVNVLATNASTNGASTGISNTGGAAQIKGGSVEARTSGTGAAIGVFNGVDAATLVDSVQIAVQTSGTPVNQLIPDAIGISNNHASPVITHSGITARTTGGGSGVGIAMNNSVTGVTTVTVEHSRIAVTTEGAAFTQGILNNTAGTIPAALVVRHSAISASGANRTNCQAYGVNTFGAPTSVHNTTINASVGTGCLAAVGLILQGAGSDLQFNGGSVKSTQYALYNNSGSARIRVGGSYLDAPNIASGSVTCTASYRGDYTALSATCL